ncbi:S-adenosyl-L-methionine-dependent methyltransferase [Gonapodya prolifera JEL478]|uniref:S-adenosyl-L-methionine-dependent methyltransferase n=1 Tax=Gonapodya prolifera (strain JEL478) TaxID=1344416 RepID=A0A139AQ03_GONPJ|nr:S-adenosyl-L-methionine-dependent methyltransferase [Gonapodya prolifera JEL478]|eukprot:KXS18841.1 S-adenosyl-L-methionine-dependent methyltransferase [Gonapodya prolifera JEL478]
MDSLSSAELESTHVHSVYEAIAPHFSDTRYKPWPVVERFLNSQPDGSIGADVGCGNGKYLGVNKKLFIAGSDRSFNLSKIAHERGFECLVCDNLKLPYRDDSFDFVLSIAVIHHMASEERRVLALKELVRILKPGGRMLVFVWAMEQHGRRRFDQQDVFVTWNLPKDRYRHPPEKDKPESETVQTTTNNTRSCHVVYDRFYHLFLQGELDRIIELAGGVDIEETGYDRDNWFVISKKRYT